MQKNTDSYKKYGAITVLISFFLICCGKNTSPLDQFHKKFRKKIDRTTLVDFKKVEEEGLRYDMYPLLRERAIEVLKTNVELNDQIDSQGTLTENAKAFLLIISFHRVLDNKDVRLVELIKEFDKQLKAQSEYVERYAECDRKKAEIAQLNLRNWSIGDTLGLSFPVYFKDNIRNAFYYECPSGYASDTSDYLRLTGILAKKDTVNFSDGNKDWRFYLKVVDLSDFETYILLEHIVLNDTIRIDLKHYGRLIDR